MTVGAPWGDLGGEFIIVRLCGEPSALEAFPRSLELLDAAGVETVAMRRG